MRVLGTGQEIALPVAGDRAVLNAGRPLRNRHRIENLPTQLSRLRRKLAAPHRPTRAQMGGKFMLQDPACLHKEAAIDRLVRHTHGGVIRIHVHEPAGDLSGRPVRPELRGDRSSQRGGGRQPTGLGPLCLLPRTCISVYGTRYSSERDSDRSLRAQVFRLVGRATQITRNMYRPSSHRFAGSNS